MRTLFLLACVGVAACSSNGSGSGSGNDAGSGRDASGDDASTGDGGADGGPKTFCSTQTDAFFCADFDTPGEPVNYGFSGSSFTGGGASALDTKSFVSAPASATFSVMGGTGLDESAGVDTSRTYTSGVPKQTLGFQLHVDAGCAPAADDAGTSGVVIAGLSVGFPSAGDGGPGGGEIDLVLLPGKAAIVEQIYGTQTTPGTSVTYDLPAIPTGRWVAVALTFDPAAKAVTVGVDGASPTSVGLTLLPTTMLSGRLSLLLGETNFFPDMPTCALGFDNVVWAK